jgi:hypothetical protein
VFPISTQSSKKMGQQLKVREVEPTMAMYKDTREEGIA